MNHKQSEPFVHDLLSILDISFSNAYLEFPGCDKGDTLIHHEFYQYTLVKIDAIGYISYTYPTHIGH